MSSFQIIVIAVFIFLAIVGVVVFAGFGGINKTSTPEATVWGTVSAQQMGEYVRSINGSATIININYVQKRPETFDSEFVNALAEGKGPDVVLLTDDMLYKQRNKLVAIGYKTFPEREYNDTFIEAANHFMSPDGILAVPFSVDPMVMYWNKDIFSTAAVARPPRLWTDLSIIGPSIIKRNETSSILRALVPFGEYRNVNNAKEILATLFFQSGNNITSRSSIGENIIYSSLDENNTNSIVAPAEAVLSFYTEFSNPVKPLYTWNRSLGSSQDAFLAGDLAMYFGKASELEQLRSKNPNLNFDVALIPQANESPKVTYGSLMGLAIVRNSPKVADALTIISIFTQSKNLQAWSDISGLPPVRRDLLVEKPRESYKSVFNEAALQSKTWFDPDPVASNQVFQDMIESITTGRGKTTDAVATAKQQLDNLLKEK
ncbi:MAG: hypothetical protein RL094_605 [Candidatus Parcubacteria bacterium]|jgi:ABC-type glycerol-3-phosphate transport system substrate-binding protein